MYRVDHELLAKLLAWGHATAIENILKQREVDYVISDKFADEKVLEAELGDLGKKVKLKQRVRAESNTSVAAASIIARAEFVQGLQRLSFKYGMELPLGAGDQVIKAGKEFIKKFDRKELAKVSKIHFKTFSDL